MTIAQATVKHILELCGGLAISIREFFASDLFDDIEQEVRQSSAAAYPPIFTNICRQNLSRQFLHLCGTNWRP